MATPVPVALADITGAAISGVGTVVPNVGIFIGAGVALALLSRLVVRLLRAAR